MTYGEFFDVVREVVDSLEEDAITSGATTLDDDADTAALLLKLSKRLKEETSED